MEKKSVLMVLYFIICIFLFSSCRSVLELVVGPDIRKVQSFGSPEKETRNSVEQVEQISEEEEEIIKTCTVNVQVANIRKEPNTKCKVIDQAKKGSVLKILDEQGSWLQVELDVEKTGWIYNKLVDREPEIVQKQELEVVVKEATIREGPGNSHAEQSKVKRGTKLIKIEEKEGWIKVRLPDNTEGWIYKEVVKLKGSISQEE